MTGWTAIIPVKPWGLSKSRLDLSNERKFELARAFSLDVLSCVTNTPVVGRVIVVTSQPELQSKARAFGATVLSDRPLLATDPLNDAIRLARSWAKVNAPAARAVVIPADLPSITLEALSAALDTMSRHRLAFVPDSDGSGTTLLSADSPELLKPRYGPGSGRRHFTNGYTPAANVDPRMRCDVDTTADLCRAVDLGVGHETSLAARPTVGPGRVNGGAEHQVPRAI